MFAAFAVIAAVLWSLLWGFAHTDLTTRMRPLQLTLFFGAFAVYAPAAYLVWRFGSRMNRAMLVFVIAVGIIFRLTLAPVRPVTTSDIYRYLWEGRMINSGVDPYRESPASPTLAPFRDWVWDRVQHKRVRAAYPPVAQYVFALADRIPASRVVTLKLVLMVFDLGTLLLLPGLLLGLGRPPAWALLYAWHPLVVGEVVARGHLDSIGVFFLVLAMRLLLLPAPRPRALAGAALAASVLAKGYAIVALPFFLLAARPFRRWFGLGFAAVAFAAYLPFISAGSSLFSGIAQYATDWTGYAPVFPLVDWVFALLTPSHALAARRVCGAALAAWLALMLFRQRRADTPVGAFDSSFLALAAFYLLSPVLYPWYLSWTVPFLCLRPRPGWLILTGTVFLFYAHVYAGSHATIPWVTALEYGLPVCAAVATAAAHAVSRARQEAPGPGRAEGADGVGAVTVRA